MARLNILLLLAALALALDASPLLHRIKAPMARILLVVSASIAPLLPPLPSSASTTTILLTAQGAAEMDAEFYLRNLFRTQPEEKGKTRAAIFKSPRTIDKAVADQVINIVVKSAGGTPVIQESDILQNVHGKLAAFKQFAPIIHEDTSDQYFADIKLNSLYHLVAHRIPTSEQRVAFRERVGDGILDSIIARQPSLPLRGNGAGSPDMNQAEIARGVEVILRDFENSGLIKGFSFDAEDFGDERFAKESFSANQAVSTEIKLTEPCNVLSFIEGVKENTFFHPDFVGTTLVQYLRRCSYDGRFEDYLLDEFYRESNFDVRAQDVVLELRMGKRGTFP